MKQSSKPKVSVLMSVYYNSAEYAGEAIESILTQEYKNYEFIIMDNASPYKYADMIASYAKKDKRIRVISNVQCKNFGIVQQQLIEEAIGEYMAFAHSDDVYLPDRLAKQVEYLDSYPDVGLLASSCYLFGREKHDHIVRRNDHDIKSFLLSGSVLHMSSIIIRRSLVDLHGLRMTSHLGGADDYQFFVSAAAITNLAILPNILFGWRRHDKQATEILGEELVAGYRSIILSHLDKFGIKIKERTLVTFSEAHLINRFTAKESMEICKLILSIASINDFYGYSGVSDRFIQEWRGIIKEKCPRYIYEIFRLILLSKRSTKQK